jgi:ectoine hydroxylase-related dioxygenase (phytanoyl-CoA dioxygenase family)
VRLTNEQRRSYEESGFLAVENVVSPERLAAMRRRLEELCSRWDSEEGRRLGIQQEADIAGATAAVKSAATVRKLAALVPHEPAFRQHATNAELLDLVEGLIGTPISLYADQALLKPPFVGSEKLPHQDNAYFRIVPDSAVITCWCALDDATVENGCMHYLPGSHRWGIVEHEAIAGTPHLVPKGCDLRKMVAVPIRAGGVIFHHSCTLHYSPANHTPHWRRAFACHFVRSDAETPRREAEAAPLLRLR